MPLEWMAQSLKRVLPAAATPEDSNGRPILEGVNMAYHLKGIEMAAADGFVMAVDRVFCKVDKTLSGVIAASTVKHIVRLASAYAKNEANMVLHLPKNRGKGTVKDKAADYTYAIDFHNPNVKLISAFVGGTFPGYKQLIPDQWQSRAFFDPAQMLSLVKSLHVDKDDPTSQIIRLHLEPENHQVRIRREVRWHGLGDEDGCRSGR